MLWLAQLACHSLEGPPVIASGMISLWLWGGQD